MLSGDRATQWVHQTLTLSQPFVGVCGHNRKSTQFLLHSESPVEFQKKMNKKYGEGDLWPDIMTWLPSSSARH